MPKPKISIKNDLVCLLIKVIDHWIRATKIYFGCVNLSARSPPNLI